MRHKFLAFLEAMMELEDSLDGLVEADETYAGDVVSATEYTFRCSDRRKGEIFNAALDKKLDLTGEKYGRLTVLTPAENIGRRTAWLCRCECGKETVVLTSRLRSGHTKSCGCAFQHTVRPAYCRP